MDKMAAHTGWVRLVERLRERPNVNEPMREREDDCARAGSNTKKREAKLLSTLAGESGRRQIEYVPGLGCEKCGPNRLTNRAQEPSTRVNTNTGNTHTG